MVQVKDIRQIRRVRKDGFVASIPLSSGQISIDATADIAGRAEPFDDVTRGIKNGYGSREGPSDRAIRTANLVLQFEHALGFDSSANRFIDRGLLILRYVLFEPGCAGVQRIRQEFTASQKMHLTP